MDKIGVRVRTLRKAKRLSQTELARRIGITQPSLSQIESGKTESLAATTLDGLCRELGTTNDYILHGNMTSDPELEKLKAELNRIVHLLPVEARSTLLGAARGILDAMLRDAKQDSDKKH